MKPFEGAGDNVSDDALGCAWMAFYRMDDGNLAYFAAHHPDARVKEKAQEIIDKRAKRASTQP